MPTVTEETAQQKTKAYAKKVEEKLKELTARFIPDYWAISATIAEIHEKNVWQILGYESRDEYIELFPISRASWYERKKLYQEFVEPALRDDAITLARLNRLPSQNAKQLIRLGPKRMLQQKWIEKALNMTESELTAQVDHVLNNESEPEDGLGQPESQAVIKWTCTTSQKQMIEESIWDFCNRQGLPKDEEPQALVLMLADYKASWPAAGKVVED